MTAAEPTTALPTMVLTRTYHAPRTELWNAFTDPQRLKNWWGPYGFNAGRVENDLRPGGQLRIDMQGPGGTSFPMIGLYKEISAPERLVQVNGAMPDEKGIPAFETLMTVGFAEEHGRTTLTVRNQVLHAAPHTVPALAGMEEGWSQQLERLGAEVGSLVLAVADDEPILWMTRIFDAPRDLVWQAVTDPNHLRQWWGQREATTIVCEMDPRPGGKWRIHQQYPDGNIFKFVGEIREVEPPKRVVQTFGMEGMFEGKVIVETLTLTEIGPNRTLYKVVSRFENFEDRAGMIASGMSYGAQTTLDRLSEHLRGM